MEPNNQPAMNNQTPPVDNTPSSQSPIQAAHNDKKVGPIIATLLIVIVLIFVALYLFASHITSSSLPDDATVSNNGASGISAQDGVQPVTSKSTDVNSLQNDLNNSTTGLDNQNF
jgi:hypothetical protein